MNITARICGLALLLSTASLAEVQASPRHGPRGAATDVANDEIKTAVLKGASTAVSDQQLRVVSINSEYKVGVGVMRRATTEGRNPCGRIEHSQITAVY